MRELMSYLPENYPDSRETVAFQGALQPEIDEIWRARDDLLAQLDPYTATWGLSYWEDALGLGPCEGLQLEVRRRQIVAKLQGRATTTPEVVKTVAETLLETPVKVIELFSEYTVLLETGTGYLPGDRLSGLRRQMRDIMPAHLDWQLVIPTVVHIKIRSDLGSRQVESCLPTFKKTLPPGIIWVGPFLWGTCSTTALPMAAITEGEIH